MDDAVFELNGQTLIGIGAVLGALAGAVSFLFKALISSKDGELKIVKERLDDALDDRDFWRDVALGVVRPGDREAWANMRSPQPQPASRSRRRSGDNP
ncbi:MAG TPA: hypothetical protein VFQ46_07810 [Candidatus Limnocylindria bacterium]|nr:hypothetical protein [Candidatus Limnocylindria bacterium]